MRKFINSFIEFFYFDFLKFIPLQTFKYLVCGSTTVMVDYTTFYIFNNVIFKEKLLSYGSYSISPHVAASVICFMTSFPVGFALNKYIAFSDSELRGRVQLFRYALTVFSCFIFSIFFIKLFVDFFHLDPNLSKWLTIIVVATYSYFAQQYFSFQVKSIKRSTS